MSGTSGTPTAPASRGVFIGLESTATRGIGICAGTSQYIDFTTICTGWRGKIVYNTTNNNRKWQVNLSSAPALTLNSTTLTTNQVSITGTW